MNIKKIKIHSYLFRTFVLAAPGGAIIVYVTINLINNIYSSMLLAGLLSGLLGIAISAKNYKQLIAPMNGKTSRKHGKRHFKRAKSK